MSRPYTDPVEVVTEPLDPQSPFIPADAKIVVGAAAPASPDPIPIVLTPGFEYRMREWRNPSTHQAHWMLERRKSTLHADDQQTPKPKLGILEGDARSRATAAGLTSTRGDEEDTKRR